MAGIGETKMTVNKIMDAYKAQILNFAPIKGKHYDKARFMYARLRGENLRKLGNSYAFQFEQDGNWYLYYMTSTKEIVIDYDRVSVC